MSALVHYEEMRVAVQTCARIDDAADMLDKAAALAAYARQRKDVEVDVWMTEIRRRAEVRIGELSRELDTNQRARSDLHPGERMQTKTEALADAGISTSTAHEYEQLTGGADARGEAAAKRAIEETLARGRAERTPVSAKELRSAIKEAIVAELGPAPERRQPQASPLRNPAGAAGLKSSRHPIAAVAIVHSRKCPSPSVNFPPRFITRSGFPRATGTSIP